MKDKVIGATGSISGAASVLGSWQVCHSVCLGIIALLGMLGIAVTAMPLLFLTKIAIPIWLAAVGLLLITWLLYKKKKCISKNLIILNTGLIIAGTPFEGVRNFSFVFWIIGGILALAGIALMVRERKSKRCHDEK